MDIDFKTSNSIIQSVNPSVTSSPKLYKNRLISYRKKLSNFKNMNKHQCLIAHGTRKGSYKITSCNLILIKRIGSNSRYGAVYLSSGARNQFYATKLTALTESNHTEIIISIKLSNVVSENKSPHFLLIYNNYTCVNMYNVDLPTIIKDRDYYMLICEIASGNLKQFLYEFEQDSNLILNAFQQVLLSILSFHYFTGGFYHNDCHYKNFLYHKIRAGGYFHYNIFGQDIYIENMGYVFVIWDFGLAKTNPQRAIERLNDYFRITSIFHSIFKDVNSRTNNIVPILDAILKYKVNHSKYFGSSDKTMFLKLIFNINGLFTREKPKQHIRVINDVPYEIKDF